MPDRRQHRGKHPEDEKLFDACWHQTLRTAVGELSWLLTREYSMDASVKLVGDRYQLTARQRMAVRRSACSDASLQARREKRIEPQDLKGTHVGIDGYNLLITIESALSSGLVLIGRDGCYRDLASLHGTYRKVQETVPAIELVTDTLVALGVRQVAWYLDRPVSNSGRLRGIILETTARAGPTPAEAADAAKAEAGDADWCRVELVPNPDAVLAQYAGPVISSDSVILDRCRQWANLAAHIIDSQAPTAWKVDLRPQ